jgi:hypothetical protein
MKKLISAVSNVHVHVLLCSSAAVLLSACGAGTVDNAPSSQTAAYMTSAQTTAGGTAAAEGATSATPDSPASSAANAATPDNVAAEAPAPAPAAVANTNTGADADTGTAVAGAYDSPEITAAPASAKGAPAAIPENSTRLLASFTAGTAATTTTPTTGKHLYVATTGSDSNPGTQAKPVKTIGRADALASAGYTIHVAAGTYRVSAPSLGSVGIKTTKSGTSAAHIKFVSDVKWGAKIIVSGTGITWDSRGSYVDIEGFDISGTGRHGILAAGANLSMSKNFIHDLTISGGCNGSGGAAIDTYGPVGNVLITGNVVRNIGYSMISKCNTVQGIYIANANNVVTNNIVSGVAMAGIQQWHGATASTIVNNTVFHTKDGILLGQGDAGTTNGSANNYVANNVVYDNTTYGIVELGKMAGNNRYANNLIYSSGTSMRVKGTVTGAVSANPKFVKYLANGAGDYRVLTGSPAINKGTSLKAPTVDYAGVARPRGGAVDIGAYEF